MKDSIENSINSLLPSEITETWKERMDLVSDLKGETLKAFLAPAKELLELGGKRWRPLVTHLTCKSLGGGDKALPYTPLVEIPHNGTLLIDDIEDSSPTRRGEPAAYLTHGLDRAINSGNFIYFLPTILIEESTLSNSSKLRLYSAYSRAMRRVHLGQGLDIEWHNHSSTDKKPPSEVEYFEMCRLKTGSLSAFSAQIGAILAEVDEEKEEFLSQIWEQVGVGFQIMDDVKNLTDDIEGKEGGDDIVEKKRSLPVVYFLNEFSHLAPQLYRYMEEASLKGAFEGKEAINNAIALLNSKGVIKKAQLKGESILKNAYNSLKLSIPESDSLNELLSLLDRFL